MAIVYYPKNNLIAKRDTISSSFETIVLASSPQVILYFDTASSLLSSSIEPMMITSSWSVSASWAPGNTVGGETLITGATYPITASNAVSASWAPTGTAGSGTTLETGSTYPITASNAESASYALFATAIEPTQISPDFTLSSSTNVLTLNLRGDTNTGGKNATITSTPGGLSLDSDGGKILITKDLWMASNKNIYGNQLFGTASQAISSSYAVSASWAPATAGSGTTLVTGSTYEITASWAESASWSPAAGLIDGNTYQITASSAVSASWAPSAASETTNYTTYTTVTEKSNWVTCSFANASQVLDVSVGKVYNFTCSNMPAAGQTAEMSVYLNNTATATSSLSFPATWKNLGPGWPTSLTASKVAVLVLKAYNTNIVIGSFNSQT